MKRRDFLRFLSASLPIYACGCSSLSPHGWPWRNPPKDTPITALEDLAPAIEKSAPLTAEELNHAKMKVVHFYKDFPDDIFCTEQQKELINDVLKKFRAVQKRIGFGNFNLLGMDEFFQIAKYTGGMDPVTDQEKQYLEELFFTKAEVYGFYGDKTFSTFTEEINKKETFKVPYTGHFLRKGPSLETYEKIRKDVGESVTLTSGVRSLAKQFHLFLEKTSSSQGNLSKASRSIAPPGYSFHGKNDFDIGKIGFGLNNFTDAFAETHEFKVLKDLGYVSIRYEELNDLGVRFEPWHIKI